MANWLTPVRTAVRDYLRWELANLAPATPTGVCSAPNILAPSPLPVVFDSSWVGRKLEIANSQNTPSQNDGIYKITSVAVGGGSVRLSPDWPHPTWGSSTWTCNWAVASLLGNVVRTFYGYTAGGKLPSNITLADCPILTLAIDVVTGTSQATVATTEVLLNMSAVLISGGTDQADIENLACLLYDRFHRGRMEKPEFGVDLHVHGFSRAIVTQWRTEFQSLPTGASDEHLAQGFYWRAEQQLQIALRRLTSATA